MTKTKKTILLVMSALLLVVLSIGGTVAYLTSNDTVVNTFTVGNVKITLDETAVDEYGELDKEVEGRVKENTYKLLPGHEYIKDPIVHVEKGSEECYVRIIVTVSDIAALKAAFPAEDYPDFYKDDLFLLQEVVAGWDKSIWPVNAAGTTADGTYEFRYKTTVDARKEAKNLEALFTSVVIPGSVENDAIAKLAGVTITAKAEAIQADGFATADLAWAAIAEEAKN